MFARGVVKINSKDNSFISMGLAVLDLGRGTRGDKYLVVKHLIIFFIYS
jgi:hypothetical protein